MKEAGGGDEKHTSNTILGEWRCDVTGDHTGFGKDLDFSINEPLYAILSCNPKYASGVFVHRANAFVELTRTLADIDSAGRCAVEDAASVCADPKIVVAAVKHGVDGLVIDETINLNRYVLEALAIEGSESGGCSQLQNAVRPLGYHAHVVFGQTVFDLPILLLILRKAQGDWRRCSAGDDRHKTDEKRRNAAEYEARGDARPRPSCNARVRGTGFHVRDRVSLTHHIFRAASLKLISALNP